MRASLLAKALITTWVSALLCTVIGAASAIIDNSRSGPADPQSAPPAEGGPGVLQVMWVTFTSAGFAFLAASVLLLVVWLARRRRRAASRFDRAGV